jgi:broad specificity phosphatase PhoE
LGDVPRVVCALARERLFHGSDIGRLVSELSGEHADWDMSELGDGAWWYAPEGRDPFTTAELEPAETFEARMEEFVAWLEDRPEKSIAVVSHWGVCYSLTGDEFQNCELRSLDFASDVIAGNGSFGKFDVFLEKSIVGKVARALLNFMSKLF